MRESLILTIFLCVFVSLSSEAKGKQLLIPKSFFEMENKSDYLRWIQRKQLLLEFPEQESEEIIKQIPSLLGNSLELISSFGVEILSELELKYLLSNSSLRKNRIEELFADFSHAISYDFECLAVLETTKEGSDEVEKVFYFKLYSSTDYVKLRSEISAEFERKGGNIEATLFVPERFKFYIPIAYTSRNALQALGPETAKEGRCLDIELMITDLEETALLAN